MVQNKISLETHSGTSPDKRSSMHIAQRYSLIPIETIKQAAFSIERLKTSL